MKRICLLLVIASLFVSCQNEDPGTMWDNINLEARQVDWRVGTDQEGLNRYYYCEFPMPEITPYVYSEGIIQVYYDMNGAQQVLPTVRHYENAAGDKWTQTVDYEYSPGSITVFVTNSDFYGNTPPDMNFRAVLMW